MTTANTVLTIARGEIGYQQASGHPTKYGNWYGEPGFEKAAWCAMFVSWVMAQAQLRLPPIQNKQGFAYCPYGLSWFRDNKMLHRTPQRGDIVFFDWGRDGLADHVGFVLEVHPTHIKTIEGNTSISNQSNGRKVMIRTRYYASCCGFARPSYTVPTKDWDGFYLELRDPYLVSDRVLLAQEILIGYGFDIKADMEYGPKTEYAIRKFQRENNLDDDGVIGPKTWKALIDFA